LIDTFMEIRANQALIINLPHLAAIFVVLAPSDAYGPSVVICGMVRKQLNDRGFK